MKYRIKKNNFRKQSIRLEYRYIRIKIYRKKIDIDITNFK